MVEGSYSYLTPEGDEVEVAYTANENGYFPTVGASIDSFSSQYSIIYRIGKFW